MSRNFLKSSIAWRLYAIILGVVLLAGSICGYIYYYKTQDDLIYESLLDNLSLANRTPHLVDAIVADLLIYQQQHSSELQQRIRDNLAVTATMIAEVKGATSEAHEQSLFLVTGMGEILKNLNEVADRILTRPAEDPITEDFYEDIELLELLPDVLRKNAYRYVNRELDFALDLHVENSNRNRLLGLVLAVFTVITLALLALLIVIVRRSIIIPLREVEQSIYSYHGGPESDDGQSEVVDEIGSLNRSFKAMVAQVKDREKALRRSEMKYRQFYNLAPVMLYNIDTDGNIVAVNDEWVRQLGYQREDVLGKPSIGFLTAESQKKAVRLFAQLYADGTLMDISYEMVDNSGGIHSVLLSSHVEKDADGNLTGARAAIVDVSERERMRREGEELKEQLLQAQKMEAVGTLAGGIAHDFNNILSSIFGFTELAKMRTEGDDAVQQQLGYVLESAERAKSLVEHLLTFSRRSNVVRSVMSVAPLLKETIKFISATLPATITITSHIEDDQIAVTADPTQIHQILMNLLTNASHAMDDKEKGTIDIKLERVKRDALAAADLKQLSDSEYVKLTISDNGEGIPEDVIERVFDPFFTTKEKGKGSGLGLSVTYGIVQEMDGEIRVSSEAGEGTTFEIFLPEASVAEVTDSVVANVGLIRGSGVVMLVDDEESILRWVSQMLDSLGYRVITCRNAEDALQIFWQDSDAIDIVVTDLTMPGMSGTDLARKISTVCPDLPIILTTGFPEELNESSLEDSGINLMLQKPVVPSELSAAINIYIQKSQGGKQV